MLSFHIQFWTDRQTPVEQYACNLFLRGHKKYVKIWWLQAFSTMFSKGMYFKIIETLLPKQFCLEERFENYLLCDDL